MAAKTASAGFDMVAICQALGDPTRFAVVKKLVEDGPTACGAFGLDCPPATLSHHFNVLRNVGLIRTEVAGTRRINVLQRDELEAHFPGFLRSLFPQKAPARGKRLRARAQRG